jgi:hypothetical protein
VPKICGDAALVGDPDVQAGADQLVGQRRLHVGEADHQVGLSATMRSILPSRKAETRGFSCRARRGRTV